MSQSAETDIDLFNQKYSELDMSEGAIAQRLEYFRLKGYSAQELAVYFFPFPVSRITIYLLYKRLHGVGFKKIKKKRYCIVCEGELSSHLPSTRMHPECRKLYFSGRRKEDLQRERGEKFREVYRRILRE